MNIFEQIGEWFTSGWGQLFEFINRFFGGLDTYIADWLTDRGLSIVIPNEVFTVARDLFRGVGYIFPVQALLPIPLAWLSFYGIKLAFAVYQLIASTVITKFKIKI